MSHEWVWDDEIHKPWRSTYTKMLKQQQGVEEFVLCFSYKKKTFIQLCY